MRFGLWLGVMACGGTEGSAPVDLTSPSGGSDTEVTFPPPVCDPVPSSCGSEGSIVSGQVRVAADIGRKTGDLFIALTHSIYDGPLGGGYHASTVIPGVDLSEPVPFSLDMCLGGEMWSEDNCGYGLVVILDTNGNQDLNNLLPDDNEPATRVGGLVLSCGGESQCLDVVIDCKGPECVQFTDEPNCACDMSCGSIVALCQHGF